VKKLLILGAGGYGKTVADVAQQLGIYEQIRFLDDQRTGEDILGRCEEFARFSDRDTEVYPAFGGGSVRMKWLTVLLEAGMKVPSLVHPRAYISPKAKLGIGTVVLPLAVVNTGVVVGNGCIINIGALIDHDSVIEDGVHLAPGAIVKAENRIPAGIKIGSGEVIENRQYPL
jgi:UDP-N-acetylbacillosamine N-acetyltransferase